MSLQTSLFVIGEPKRSKVAAKVEEIVGNSFDVRKFVDSFEALAEAPAGIAALRRFVLDLAVRGRLVAEQSTDAPQTIVVEGDPETETAHLPPFDVPSSWAWTNVDRICRDSFYGPRFGKNEYVSSGGVPTIRTTDMTDAGEIVLRNAPEVRVPADKLRLYQVEQGDLLITRTGSIGIMAVFNGDYVAIPSAYLIRFRFLKESVLPRFIYTFLKSSFGQERLGLGTTTTAQPNVNATSIRAIPVPVPPLAEQKRIVAKVDQLMALCDELEARQTKKRETGARLTKSALEALTTAEGPKEFDVAWKRVVDNFDTLIDRAEKVHEVRRAIVSLALRGALLPQIASDAAVIATGMEEGRIAGGTWDAPSSALPSLWTWVPLKQLVTWGPKNGYSPKGVEFQTPVKSLTLTATTSGRFDGRFFKYIDEEIPPSSDLWLRDGDILVQRGNTIEYVGVAAIYRGRDHEFIYPDLMMKLRVSDLVDSDFIHLALNGPAARSFVTSRASGTSGSMPKINQTTLLEVPIPLPPLDEQRRIMRKVEQLMTICDDLDARLRRAEDRVTKLVEAAVQELVG